jgi:hypothetical protein
MWSVDTATFGTLMPLRGRPPCTLPGRLVAADRKLARRASPLGATTVHLVP